MTKCFARWSSERSRAAGRDVHWAEAGDDDDDVDVEEDNEDDDKADEDDDVDEARARSPTRRRYPSPLSPSAI